MEFFDVKLFLLTFKDVAKVRRFSRTPYMDFPYGGRTEGQYWKTEGYFDGVAWPNYERSHSWLLTDGKDKEGKHKFNDVKHLVRQVDGSGVRSRHWRNGDVSIRAVDASVEDTLR
jgi:hypothetical protein